jgi:hypothetical protein
MEVFLHLWDELDDVVSACRHVAASAASELVDGALPLAAGVSALGVAVFDGLYRQLLRLSA